jgi:hypothetical protein
MIVLMATTGIAACGGDDDAGSASEPNSDGDDEGDESTTTTEAGAVDGDLSELLERQEDAVIKVTYDDGDDGFVIAQDHDKRAVTTGDTVIISDGERTITCDDLDTEPTCTEIPEGVEDLATFGLGFFGSVAQGLAEAADSLDGAETSDEEIAGRDATCVEYDARAVLGDIADDLDLGTDVIPEGSARVCVDNETGFLLEFSTEAGNGDESEHIIATKVEEPSDSDFEPPAEVRATPDLGSIDDLIEQNT